MDEQAQTKPVTQPPPEERRLFLIVDIQGDPRMVKSYMELLTMQIHTSVEFYSAMFLASGKKKMKLPRVSVIERQAE